MAKLVPAGAELDAEHLANVRGWLPDDDPYFDILDEIVRARSGHLPRVASRGRTRRTPRQK
jgi:hypothetical protein